MRAEASGEQFAAQHQRCSAERAMCERSPSRKLLHVSRMYSRMLAATEGLLIAHRRGYKVPWEPEIPGDWSILFPHTVLALESRDAAWLDRILTMAELEPSMVEPIVAGFGYVDREKLTGIVASLLESLSVRRREIGLRACAEHRVATAALVESQLAWAQREGQPQITALALLLAAVAGVSALSPACLELCSNKDIQVSAAAAFTSVLLGERRHAIAPLATVALRPGPMQDDALLLLLRVADAKTCQATLKALLARAQAPGAQAHDKRLMLLAAGYAGEVAALEGLFAAMEHPATAQLAGAAFALITGADLAALDLDRPPPQQGVPGPTDDPADDDVELDPDTGAAWPDAAKVRAWWQQHARRAPPGQRLLCGQPQSPHAALDVLRTGFQHQRRVAAHDLALLQPGRPLFHWFEPTWRQSARMDALDALHGVERASAPRYVSVFARAALPGQAAS